MSDEIGPNIRRRRQRLGWSLEQLAEKSGVSSTMLSEVERSLKNPTVKLAYQIARALGCTLTELLGEPAAQRVTVVRAKDLLTFVDPESGLRRIGLRSDLLDHKLEIVRYDIPPGEETGQMDANRPGVIEQIIVLSGELSVTIEDKTYELEEGDAISYDVARTNYRNGGAEPCSFLLLSDTSRVV